MNVYWSQRGFIIGKKLTSPESWSCKFQFKNWKHSNVQFEISLMIKDYLLYIHVICFNLGHRSGQSTEHCDWRQRWWCVRPWLVLWEQGLVCHWGKFFCSACTLIERNHDNSTFPVSFPCLSNTWSFFSFFLFLGKIIMVKLDVLLPVLIAVKQQLTVNSSTALW